MTLDELMIKLADGDKKAFEEIYLRTKKAVYYVALSIVRERSLAEDVMQSAYLNVIRKAGEYRVGSNASAWIARIARNQALNTVRSRKRVAYVDENENLSIFGTQNIGDYGLLTDLARRILSDDEFAVLMLVTSEGYKRREIAEMLGLPVPTVSWKYNCALKKLRKALEEKD